MPFWHVLVTFSLETVLPLEQVSNVPIYEVMCILILPHDNWYPAINGSKAVPK